MATVDWTAWVRELRDLITRTLPDFEAEDDPAIGQAATLLRSLLADIDNPDPNAEGLTLSEAVARYAKALELIEAAHPEWRERFDAGGRA